MNDQSSMRALLCEMPPPDQIQGTTTYTLEAPLGWRFVVEQEPNNTWTVSLKNAFGSDVVQINSGVSLTCSAFAAGAGLMVTSFTRNPTLGNKVASMTFAGCTASLAQSWEDGDEYADIGSAC